MRIRMANAEIAQLMKKFNLTRDDFKRWNKHFHAQKNGARRRKIPFLFTFEEWLKKWFRSKYVSKRGFGIGKYCMHRKGNEGPYSYQNTTITPHNKNVSIGLRGNKNSLGFKHPYQPRPWLIGNQRAAGSKVWKTPSQTLRSRGT